MTGGAGRRTVRCYPVVEIVASAFTDCGTAGLVKNTLLNQFFIFGYEVLGLTPDTIFSLYYYKSGGK